MNANDAPHEILQRLQNVLETARLSDDAKNTARALAKRLSSPVRVTCAGPPKTGKSTLVNAFAKDTIVPVDMDLPTYEAVYADTPHIIATTEDGATQKVEGLDFDALTQIAPVFFQLHVPLDILKRIQLLEIVTDGSPEELTAATQWAAKRSDILIWCSRTFSDAEKQLWCEMPAKLQDHSFLVLTQADTMPGDALSERLDELCTDVGDVFRMIAPVAAKQALRAQLSNRPEADQMVKASGFTALRSQLLRDINLGRQTDMDHASMFLQRYEGKPKTTPRPNLSKPLEGSRLAQLNTPEPPEQDSSKQSFVEGAEYLRNQARVMLADIEELGPFAPKRIVDRCFETANGLMDLVADSYPSAEPEELALDAATEAADVLLLMTMEDNSGAAEDAVSLLLQVQRDFECAAAA